MIFQEMQMTDTSNHNSQPVLVAIDIAKRSHDIVIQWPTGKTRTLKIPNTREGYKHLLDTIGDHGESIHATILGASFGKCGITHAVFTTQFRYRGAGFVLLQYGRDPAVCVS
jgi:hypothetical protein